MPEMVAIRASRFLPQARRIVGSGDENGSDVFKVVICETKWRQQAEDNPDSHGGRRNNSGRKQFFLFRQRQEKGRGEVEKKNSARNIYLQVVVTGQT